MNRDVNISLFILLSLLFYSTASFGQLVQNFNQSINQIGDCWRVENMEITTKNTINNGNQKKALVGNNPIGNPAYSFRTPFIEMNGTGSIDFKHKLNANNGDFRQVNLYLYDRSENLVQNLYTHTYRSGGAAPNGNPTNAVSVSLPINYTGVGFLVWEFIGSGGGSSNAMLDDISIDALDFSNGTNNNGYSYCRPNDVVYDTICAGAIRQYSVPYPITQSTWTWSFVVSNSPAIINTNIATGAYDTIVELNWSNSASGDYILEATEVRPPHNTTSYKVRFRVHVLPAPTVSIEIDSVCAGGHNKITFQFYGNGPWRVKFTDGHRIYNRTFTSKTATFTLPAYQNSNNVEVLNLIDAKGCPADKSQLPNAQATILTAGPLGPIFHY